MTSPLRLGITGCTGRMGLALLHSAGSNDQVRISGGSVRAGSGLEAGAVLARHGFAHVKLSEDLPALAARSDALIDFTTPLYALDAARAAAEAGIALVCGTTGFTPEQRDTLTQYAAGIPLVLSSNTSIGVTVFSALVEQAANLLDEDYDIEIVEMHHHYKKDAPSGTALLLGEAAARGRGVPLEEVAAHHRDGVRQRGSIGFASLRGGDVVGDHSVIFAGPGERFELTHKASSRDIFAYGALRAAAWAVKQKPGLYAMRDVIGL